MDNKDGRDRRREIERIESSIKFNKEYDLYGREYMVRKYKLSGFL